jgi:hypothetical protein
MSKNQRVEHAEDDIEDLIEEFFEQNYEFLRREGGHALTAEAKARALDQVKFYWRKLGKIATSVTETEVKLSLPGQKTKMGRKFVVEGVVDIVRDDDLVLMYDIKTHDASEVRAEPGRYQDQLNVYAHIWNGVRGEQLDGTAIIATKLPAEMQDAVRVGDEEAIEAAAENWDPVIEIEYSQEGVDRTIDDFAVAIDGIEDGCFEPPTTKDLEKVEGKRRRTRGKTESRRFADIHCQNCDARFSCRSYQAFVMGSAKSPRRAAFFRFLNDLGTEAELDEWIEKNLSDED